MTGAGAPRPAKQTGFSTRLSAGYACAGTVVEAALGLHYLHHDCLHLHGVTLHLDATITLPPSPSRLWALLASGHGGRPRENGDLQNDHDHAGRSSGWPRGGRALTGANGRQSFMWKRIGANQRSRRTLSGPAHQRHNVQSPAGAIPAHRQHRSYF